MTKTNGSSGVLIADPSRNVVRSNGSWVQIEPRVMDILVRLAEKDGSVVSRDELIDAGWPEGYGSDEALTKAVSLLRKACGDDQRPYRIVETIPKRGYRLRAPVQLTESGNNGAVNRGSHSTVSSTGKQTRHRFLWVAVILLGLLTSANWYQDLTAETEPHMEEIRMKRIRITPEGERHLVRDSTIVLNVPSGRRITSFPVE